MLETIDPLPVFVEQIAVTQVGDAGAADFDQSSERRTVRAQAQEDTHPVTAALQRRTMVRGRRACADVGASVGLPSCRSDTHFERRARPRYGRRAPTPDTAQAIARQGPRSNRQMYAR